MTIICHLLGGHT